MLSDSERRTMRALEADLLSDAAFARAVLPAVRSLRGLAGPVVVGVAADGSSDGAVEWAASEAAARRCPLHLVHAFRSPLALDPLCGVPVAGGLAADRAAAAHVLDRALDRVRLLAPGVDTSSRAVQGTTGAALLRESRDARLLVLGAGPGRTAGGLRWQRQGALRGRLTTASRCPVAVVHRSPGTPHTPLRPRVVVGVDGRPCSDAAVGFAFAAALSRGLPLTAVHAWTADRPADLEAVTAPPVATETAAHRLLDVALDRWADRFPSVPVTAEVVRRDPAGALIAGSVEASLVVVGSRGMGRIRAAVLGSVSHAVVEGVPGPVAVVRRDPCWSASDRAGD